MIVELNQYRPTTIRADDCDEMRVELNAWLFRLFLRRVHDDGMPADDEPPLSLQAVDNWCSPDGRSVTEFESTSGERICVSVPWSAVTGPADDDPAA